MTQAPHSETTPDLADLRRLAVMTQVELAERAVPPLTEKTIVDLEGGNTDNPRPDTIRRVATALGLSPQQVAAACAESRRRNEVRSHSSEHTPADQLGAGSVRAEPDTRRTTRIVASPEAGS